jgi:hypothetical protein
MYFIKAIDVEIPVTPVSLSFLFSWSAFLSSKFSEVRLRIGSFSSPLTLLYSDFLLFSSLDSLDQFHQYQLTINWSQSFNKNSGPGKPNLNKTFLKPEILVYIRCGRLFLSQEPH